ncbi:energy-coupled thiamine transporter ThiT [Holdemania massiliensis]|uniref:energy-coupled thiamine transporter ThiT n=1 Tax=Holdemania massiliensis TaxID=1468449 RepID=UPI001F05CD73|nr:ECF transporter S component [Holdemania massiliensis]MCH1940313.1 energy-coupled thiamine transporter ThiT [Holdemania massiliensis]
MKWTTKDLVYMALYAALFIVLDVAVNTLGILQMPNGGSLGVSVIPLLMASYHLGWQKGTVVSVLSILLQYVTGPMYTPDLLGFLLDYFIAFSVYGLASLFPNYKWFYSGVLITNLIRLLSSTLSGTWVWGLDYWPSFLYNATYMIPTAILCLVLLPLVMPRLKPAMNKK